MGYSRVLSPERRPYATRDGHVCCLIYTDTQWRQFLTAIGQPEAFDTDPRLANIGTRTRHITELYQWVSDEIAQRSTAELQALLDGTDIPVFPMHTFESVLDDPHLKDIGFFNELHHPQAGTVRNTAVPSEWSGTPPGPATPAPRAGEHSRSVLREAGFDDTRIDALLACGALRE